jgi:hypothetical protein
MTRTYLLELHEDEIDHLLGVLKSTKAQSAMHRELVNEISSLTPHEGLLIVGDSETPPKVISSLSRHAVPIFYAAGEDAHVRTRVVATVNNDAVVRVARAVQRDLVVSSVSRNLRQAADSLEEALCSSSASAVEDIETILEATSEVCRAALERIDDRPPQATRKSALEKKKAAAE